MRNSINRIRLTFFIILVSFVLCGDARAQNSGAMPAGQAPGAPAGSYPLSDIDNINFFNGHLNFHLPIVAIAGRGDARFTVPFVAEQTWVMESYFNDATQSNFYYESDSWRKGLDPGFSPGVVQGYTARFYAPDVCDVQPNKGLLTHPQTLSYLTFTAPDGTQYNLYSPHGRAHFDPCTTTGFSRGRVFTTADGSAATFIADADVIDYPFAAYPTEFGVSGYLLLRDGSRYRVVDSQVTEVRDRNGNKLTIGYDVNARPHTITDSLGRVVTINYNVQEGGQYGTNTQIVFSGFGGAQRVIRLSQTNLGSALRSGYSLQPHGPDATPYERLVTSSVWLPDGRRYRLFYNDMGELARVELPTGGAIEYDHEGGLQGGDPEGTFEGVFDGVGGNYIHIYRRLVERRLYPDGGTGSAWSARTTVSKPEGATPAQTTGYVEVKQYGKQPDGSAVLLTCERHFFIGSAKPTIEQSPFIDPPSGAEINGREGGTEVYDTSGGTVGALLRKVENTWLPGDAQVEGAHISETKTTLADTGQVTRQTFSYDRYGNQTDVREYDYGAGAPGPLVRHTHTDYLTTGTIAGVTYDYACDPSTTCSGGSINPNVIYQRGLPRAQQVYGIDPSTGAETIAAKSETRYDESAYSLLPCDPNNIVQCSSVPQWTDPTTVARGNVTSVRSFINAAASADPAQACPVGVCVETHARYDQLGNVRYSWDARGNKSEVIYGDSFCNGMTCGSAGYTPNTFGFAISTKTPKPDPSGAYGSSSELTTSTVNDFYTGQPYSKTDANNKTTYFEYEDQPAQLDRLKAVVRPDGGRTDLDYGDAVGNLYVRTLSDLDAGRRTETRQYLDGLGRVYRKATYENSVQATPWLNVDATYDALGRVVMSSMPYRSTGGGVPLTAAEWSNAKRAETGYDSLGRTLRVTTMPDGAYVQTDYSGDRLLVKDQMGKERVSRTDALGRLREVWEVTPQESGPEASTVQLAAFQGHPEAAYGYLTSYKYDSLGNLRMVEQLGQHSGQQITQRRFFAYDSLGRLVRAKNSEQGSFTSDPDGGDFPALTDSASGVSNSQWSSGYLYDANGNLTKRRDARGVTVTYGYDNLSRNITVRYTDSALGAGNHTQDVDRYYDNSANGANGLGRLWKTQTSQTALNIIDLYDEAGRPKKHTQQFWSGAAWGQSFTVQQSYNKAGGVTSETYPSGHVVNYNYDAAGRPGDNGTGATFYGNLGDGAQRTYSSQVRYQETGGVEQERFGTDTPVYNKHLFNSRGQLAEIRVSTYSILSAGHETDWNRGAIINHYSNAAGAWGATGGGIDNNGNLKKQDVYIPNDDAISGYSQSTQFYDYDSLNRIYQARESYGGSNTWVQYFNYDRWGNRTINATNTTGSAPEPQFSVDASTNRLVVPTGSGGAMSYDAAGNLTNDTYQGGGTRTYDAENRMTGAQFVSGQTQTALYSYDADGRRVKRKAGAGAEVWQVYGVGGELLAEYAAGASPTSPQKEYGYRSGELLVTAEPAAGQGSAETYRASTDFSSVQGQRNWYYLDSNGAQMTFDSANNWWRGAEQYNVIWATGEHPGNAADAVRQWRSPGAGSVRITGSASDANAVGGDGVVVSIKKGAQVLWQQTIENGNATGFSYDVTTSVAAGDQINFVVNKRSDNGSDSTNFDPTIVYTPSAGTYRASTDFSNVQGQRGWYYLDSAGAQMTFDSANNWWRGAEQYNVIWADGEHPGNAADAVRRWVAPVGGTVRITGNAADANAVGGDGVIVTISKGAQVLWQQTINNGNAAGFSYDLTTTVAAGDQINFVVNKRADNGSDSTSFDPAISYAGAGSAGQVKWLVADQLGTPRMVIDQTGTLSGVRRHDYLPFGEEIAGDQNWRTTARGYSGDSVRQKFTGMERDGETGLDYFVARYHSSLQGRFTSPDPLLSSGTIHDPQTWNRYSYTVNNPLKYTDPLGLYVCNGSGAQCRSVAEGLRNLEQARDTYRRGTDEYNRLDRALRAYGAAGVDNGVTINFGVTRSGGPADTHVGIRLDPANLANKLTTVNNPTGQEITVTIDPAQTRNADDYVQNIGHEGSHVADGSDLVGALPTNLDDPRAAAVLSGPLNLTKYVTETRAYEANSFIAQARHAGTLTVGGARHEVWNSGWRQADRARLRTQGIDAVLAEPRRNGGLYEVTPANQGPRLIE